MTRLSFALAAFSLSIAFAPPHPAQAQSAAQQADVEGLWQGYDGEWHHTAYQLIALAEATPADKFAWRPAPGVRSTSEVYMHIVTANFAQLAFAGPKVPPDFKLEIEKTVT